MLADARDKWLWDQAARKRQYLKEGEAKGRAEGEVIGEARIIRRMLRTNTPIAEIAGMTGWLVAEVERLEEEEKG